MTDTDSDDGAHEQADADEDDQTQYGGTEDDDLVGAEGENGTDDDDAEE